MSRVSVDQYDSKGKLLNGFDYINQAWVQDGKYVACGHPWNMRCSCYGRRHAGQETRIFRDDTEPPFGLQPIQQERPLIPVTTTATLVQEWLFFADGLLDDRQLQQLIKRSRAFLR